MIATGGTALLYIGGTGEICAAREVIRLFVTSVEVCDASETTGTVDDYTGAERICGTWPISCSLADIREMPVRDFPTPKDFIDIRRQQNERYLLMLSIMLNVFKAGFYRRCMNSKSGFLARTGWRKKRQ